MRATLAVLLFVACELAQGQSPASFPAPCGPKNINFDVKRDKTQRTLAPPEPGKALVYFIQDMGVTHCLGSCLTSKIGVDGAWVGADQNNSYFSISVDPGEHHVCANRQSRFEWESKMAAVAHFTAEAGKTYYFRARSYLAKDQAFIDLDPIDSDQGLYLVSSYALSESRAKP